MVGMRELDNSLKDSLRCSLCFFLMEEGALITLFFRLEKLFVRDCLI